MLQKLLELERDDQWSYAQFFAFSRAVCEAKAIRVAHLNQADYVTVYGKHDRLSSVFFFVQHTVALICHET